jgi:hypothetical protein
LEQHRSLSEVPWSLLPSIRQAEAFHLLCIFAVVFRGRQQVLYGLRVYRLVIRDAVGRACLYGGLAFCIGRLLRSRCVCVQRLITRRLQKNSQTDRCLQKSFPYHAHTIAWSPPLRQPEIICCS